MSSSDDLIAAFTGVTGASAAEAKSYLEASNWDKNSAINLYFSSQDGGSSGSDGSPAPVNPSPNPRGAPVAKPTPRRGIAGFGSLSSGDNGADDSNKDTELYTGGHSSGVAVSKPRKDVAEDFFKAVASGDDRDPNLDAKPKFGGAGNVIGSGAHVDGAQGPPKTRIITMWKNGFTVDDAPLRSYDDPANAAFLDALKERRIPAELEQHAHQGAIGVDVVDKRGQEWEEPPKPAYVAFDGHGQTLGASPSPSASAATTEGVPSAAPVVDPNAPTTTIAVRLSSGKRIPCKLNHTHTVGDLRALINAHNPGASTAYDLMTTFPPKKFNDNSVTLADCGLIGAALLQKMH